MSSESESKDDRFYTPRQSARTVASSSSEGESWYSPRAASSSVVSESSESEFFGPLHRGVVPHEEKKYRRRNQFFSEEEGSTHTKKFNNNRQRPPLYSNQQSSNRSSSFFSLDEKEDNETMVMNIFSFARHNRVADVESLLARGVQPDVRDEYGNTILIIACQNGHKRIAKAALRRGADIDAQNNRGNTGLHFCFSFGYGDSLGIYLRSKGADDTILNCAGLSCYQGIGGHQ